MDVKKAAIKGQRDEVKRIEREAAKARDDLYVAQSRCDRLNRQEKEAKEALSFLENQN